jgi:hypothetical protein
MTQDEWLTCTDPERVLNFVRGRASERKLRLFAVACCRRIAQLLFDKRSRQAVQIAEQYADGLVGKRELQFAFETATAVRIDGHPSGQAWVEARNTACIACVEGLADGRLIARHAADAAAFAADKTAQHQRTWQQGRLWFNSGQARGLGAAARSQLTQPLPSQRSTVLAAERAVQAGWLRDLFGTSTDPVAVSPSWLAWNGGVVVSMAQAIYDKRRFADLPILADALEDAGCTNADVLDHCRLPAGHVRGCWVLDLVRGVA